VQLPATSDCDAGEGNCKNKEIDGAKLGKHRFLRATPAATHDVHVLSAAKARV
jgi:hypothetical protein